MRHGGFKCSAVAPAQHPLAEELATHSDEDVALKGQRSFTPQSGTFLRRGPASVVNSAGFTCSFARPQLWRCGATFSTSPAVVMPELTESPEYFYSAFETYRKNLKPIGKYTEMISQEMNTPRAEQRY
jgi:hypothetical protein